MEEESKRSSQMLKGILEGCILIIIGREPVYGYEMNEKLQRYGFSTVSEGTIYPLLLKLQTKKLIMGELMPSPGGPMRKYFKLTEAGVSERDAFIEQWTRLHTSVSQLVKGDEQP
ncbi:PadR family transcriptional regulator [Gorillibacterium sp. CAU 1737]|uniref:PadR family transcriptional regulator n=1 Tax=Gorillibacterium sp. CAU 1737 TaxID=3140362 RepID=UPI003261940F